MHAEHATIHGEVTYREGDGMPIAIPEGPVELTHADDSVTLSLEGAGRKRGGRRRPAPP